MNFNAIRKLKSTHIGEWHLKSNTQCLGLRRVRNYATPFHNFYKIVPLRSVFAPVEFSSKTLTSPINYFALYSEAGSLPRLKLRTAYAFFSLPGALPVQQLLLLTKQSWVLQGRVLFRGKSASPERVYARVLRTLATLKNCSILVLFIFNIIFFIFLLTSCWGETRFDCFALLNNLLFRQREYMQGCFALLRLLGRFLV